MGEHWGFCRKLTFVWGCTSRFLQVRTRMRQGCSAVNSAGSTNTYQNDIYLNEYELLHLIGIINISYIDCLLIALDAHMLSQDGYGPGTKAQGPKAVEHMCIKTKQ